MIQERPQIAPKILRSLESKGFTAKAAWSLAGSAGSGRQYYRISEGEKTAILQTNASANEDFEHASAHRSDDAGHHSRRADGRNERGKGRGEGVYCEDNLCRRNCRLWH